MTLRLPDFGGLPPTPRLYDDGWTDADREILLRPGALGPLALRNRVVMPAMESNLGDRGGFVTPRLTAYYGARSAGGAALIITENTSVHRSGRVTAAMLRIETDEHGAAFATLADRVHHDGARLFVQLSHAGRQTLSDFTGETPWAPSALPCPVMKEAPRAIENDDITGLIDAFAAGAFRARQAGADGVELHMAHGYLLGGFLSPDQNRRDDAWGGDTDRRCAFPCAVVAAIRARCGPEFPIQARISADEYVDGGMHPGEALEVVSRLVRAGVTSLSVSACNYESMFWNIPPSYLPEGPFVGLAGRVRAAVGVPVVAVGRLHRPSVAAAVLRRGDADFVAIGRGLIADPRLVSRIEHGNVSRIRPCLSCNRCIASISGSTLECAVNPEIGREGLGAPPSISGRRVLVVGGGPAGLTAAVRLADEGAQVRLIERRDVLGGQLDLAAAAPGKEPVQWWWRWLVTEVRSRDIEVVCGRAAGPEDLEGCDAVFWAAGSVARTLDLSGEGALPVLTLDEAVREPLRAGLRPVVVGGGAGGAEAAHALAALGARPVILEAKRKIARDLIPSLRHHMEEHLASLGVRAYVMVTELRQEGRTLAFRARPEGELRIDDATALVFAVGRTSVPWPDWLVASGVQVTCIGDAHEPGSFYEATQGS